MNQSLVGKKETYRVVLEGPPLEKTMAAWRMLRQLLRKFISINN